LSADYEDYRSIIFRQQHEDFRETEAEVSGICVHWQVQCRQIIPYQHAVQEQEACYDIQQAR
jgi:hypothetical protein